MTGSAYGNGRLPCGRSCRRVVGEDPGHGADSPPFLRVSRGESAEGSPEVEFARRTLRRFLRGKDATCQKGGGQTPLSAAAVRGNPPPGHACEGLDGREGGSPSSCHAVTTRITHAPQ
jgi:hypothetical protein